MSYISVTKMDNRHDEALRGLEFYKQDLQIQESRLREIAGKNTSFEVRQSIEHFQNQFIVQRNNIDELRHKLNEHLQLLGKDAQQHEGRVGIDLVDSEGQLSEEYMMLEKVINELRHEFNTFLSKWM